MSAVEETGAEAGAEMELEILIEGGEGTSIAITRTPTAQCLARGGRGTRCPDLEVVTGDPETKQITEAETIDAIEVARHTIPTITDGNMTDTAGMNGGVKTICLYA